jgi:hypothetical protein
VPFGAGEEAMRIRNMVVVAVPALLALALFQPQPASAPGSEPSAEQIHAAVQLAQAGAGLGSATRSR